METKNGFWKKIKANFGYIIAAISAVIFYILGRSRGNVSNIRERIDDSREQIKSADNGIRKSERLEQSIEESARRVEESIDDSTESIRNSIEFTSECERSNETESRLIEQCKDGINSAESTTGRIEESVESQQDIIDECTEILRKIRERCQVEDN